MADPRTVIFAVASLASLGRVLINRDSSAIAGCRKRRARIAPNVQAVFCRRRHHARRPPLAKTRPGSPAPTMGPGTGVYVTGPPSGGKNRTLCVKLDKPPTKLSSPKLQHVTAGLALSAPNDTKLAAVSTPAETVNEFRNGFPTYSPTPKPAVLLVTCTPVAL